MQDLGFIQAILPRSVVTSFGRFEVRAPSVREGLVLVSASAKAIAGDEDAYQLVLSVLRTWFPRELYRATALAERTEAIKTALTIAKQGCPEPVKPKKKEGDEDDALPENVPGWDYAISQYIAVYHCTVQQLMDEPWPAFLQLLRNVPAIRALSQIDTMRGSMVPQISDKHARGRLLNDMYITARIKTSRSPIKRASRKEIDASWAFFRHEFTKAGAFGGGK